MPLGQELVERYLDPLASLDALSPHIHLAHRVVSVSRLGHDRTQNISFAQARRGRAYRRVASPAPPQAMPRLQRSYPRHPFVPDDEDEFGARAAGINIPRQRLIAFVLSAFFMGIGGVLQAHFLY